MELLSYVLVLAFSGGEAVQGGPLDVNPGLILWTVVTFIFLLQFAFVLKFNVLHWPEAFSQTCKLVLVVVSLISKPYAHTSSP